MTYIHGVLLACILNHLLKSIEASAIIGPVLIDCGEGVTISKGNAIIDSNHLVEMYIYGHKLVEDLQVGITDQKNCEYVDRTTFKSVTNSHGHLAILSFIVSRQGGQAILSYVPYYFCLKSNDKWIFQGTHGKPAFYVYRPLITTLTHVILIVSCFFLSALLTGLNLGVLSLDIHELKLLRNSGSKREKSFAKKLIPIRKRGNYFLCSIVITATLCNAVATTFLNEYTGQGWLTVVISSIVIVLLCEIFPQALCTYFPLSVAGYTVYITIACMIITAPVSYPLALLLNCLLRKELANRFTRSRLREVLKMAKINSNEEKIISGTLELNEKKVEDIMTPLADVFKMSIEAIMDFETIAYILASGYSRIPIYSGEPSNISHVLLTKDLVLLNPENKVSIKNLVQNSEGFCHTIPKGTTLDKAFSTFKDSRDHMAFIVGNDSSTNVKENNVIGLITFEDIIEEIFQLEINDETDVYSDNFNKRKLTVFARTNELLPHIKTTNTGLGTSTTPPKILKLSTFHFLSGIDKFSADHISPKILMSLLDLDVFYSTPNKKPPKDNIYVVGVAADYFVMLIEGRMEVILDHEISFEVEPFRHFGVESLGDSVFVPDFTVRAIKKAVYLKIPKPLYDAAVLATHNDRSNEKTTLNVNSDVNKYYKMLIESNPNTKH